MRNTTRLVVLAERLGLHENFLLLVRNTVLSLSLNEPQVNDGASTGIFLNRGEFFLYYDVFFLILIVFFLKHGEVFLVCGKFCVKRGKLL